MEKEFDKSVDLLIESIIRASYKIKDDVKAEQYIREKIVLIYNSGKHVGNNLLAQELLG